MCFMSIKRGRGPQAKSAGRSCFMAGQEERLDLGIPVVTFAAATLLIVWRGWRG